MASKLEDSVRSDRDSMVYDDVASQGDLSKDSITEPEDVQEKGDSGALVKRNKCIKTPGQKASESKESTVKKGLSVQSNAIKSNNVDGGHGEKIKDSDSNVNLKHRNVDKNDDQESHKDKRKIRKDSDKELWTPVKCDSNENMDSKDSNDAIKTGEVTVDDSLDSHPTKPPRRHPQKKLERAASGELDQKTSPIHSPGNDPVKPPRRRLPQPPKSGKTQSEVIGSANSDEALSVTSDGSEQKPTEIVCKPVLTSSPNQDEIPGLSVETIDKMDTSRRVLSFLDESSAGGVRKVESFYDFLYSEDDSNSVAEVTSPIPLQQGDRIGSALTGSEDHLYDAVPVEDSVAESFSRRSSNGTYDEVIVNQGTYMDISSKVM